MNQRIKSKPCVKCGFPVNRSGSRTAAHYTETPYVGGMRKVRCDGSDMPYAAHGLPVEVTITEVKRSLFRKVLARLPGRPSVTWVDFYGHRMFTAELKAHGLDRPKDAAIRFVLQEVRDV